LLQHWWPPYSSRGSKPLIGYASMSDCQQPQRLLSLFTRPGFGSVLSCPHRHLKPCSATCSRQSQLDPRRQSLDGAVCRGLQQGPAAAPSFKTLPGLGFDRYSAPWALPRWVRMVLVHKTKTGPLHQMQASRPQQPLGRLVVYLAATMGAQQAGNLAGNCYRLQANSSRQAASYRAEHAEQRVPGRCP
jgi:hypothetical protein